MKRDGHGRGVHGKDDRTVLSASSEIRDDEDNEDSRGSSRPIGESWSCPGFR